MTSEGRGSGVVTAVVVALITAIVGPIAVYYATKTDGSGPSPPPAAASLSTSSTSTSTSSSSDGTESWLSAANAYCRQYDAPLKDAGQINTLQDVPVVGPKVAVLYRRMDVHLRSMSPPSAIRSQVILMTQHWDNTAAFLTQAVQYYQASNWAAAQSALSSSQASNQTGNQIAYSIGLPSCADAGTP